MTWWVASLNDEDPDRMLPKEASMVKLFVIGTAQRVAIEGMQMMGGYSYSSEYDMERLVPRFWPRGLSSRSRSTVG
jgi:isovaleryl-CoA dehydrogenase